MKEQPYQDVNFKSTETRLDYDGIIIYAKSKAKYLIKSKGSCQNHCLVYLYANQQLIKNPNAMNNCQNVEHEMKVTSSQQMMSIGDFPSPINENLLRYRYRKIGNFHIYGHTENVIIPQPISKMYFLSLNYAESFR